MAPKALEGIIQTLFVADASSEVPFLTGSGVPLRYHLAIEFIGCFLALQISYITWGIMQELIMDTVFHPTPQVPSGMFPSATFCVFSNRALAIIFASWACYYYNDGTIKPNVSLLAFTPCALSNTMSSWSQYKALNYVTFNLQTLFKSTKVVPVMLMGTLLKGTLYSFAEYMEALLITFGVAIFSFAQHDSPKSTDASDSKTQITGLILLTSYVLSDSFTAQYQSKIYKDHGKIDHFQMMFGVNVSSIIITSVALLFSGDVMKVIEFISYNPKVLWYNILTAICSTTGQVAIYYTIKRFGPITFTIIMTTRQMLSMIVSTILFGHSIGMYGVLGSACVFIAVFHSIYRQNQGKQKRGNSSPNLEKIGESGSKNSLKDESGGVQLGEIRSTVLEVDGERESDSLLPR